MEAQIITLREVDSTSAEAARRAPNLASPTWIMATHQTAAKGRRGRAWSNTTGNFAASVVYRPGGSLEARALRSFVAALALQDALVNLTGQSDAFALKWPNDVLLRGGKLAGILLETGPAETLIVGIGVNIAQAPDAADLEPGALRPVALNTCLGTVVTPSELMAALAPAYAALETQFTTYGFEPIRSRWLAGAAKRGQPITARTMQETIAGTFETIDTGGQLVLRTAGGTRAVTAGDVFF